MVKGQNYWYWHSPFRFTNGSELLDGRCTQRPYFVSSFPISFLSKRCSFLL